MRAGRTGHQILYARAAPDDTVRRAPSKARVAGRPYPDNGRSSCTADGRPRYALSRAPSGSIAGLAIAPEGDDLPSRASSHDAHLPHRRAAAAEAALIPPGQRTLRLIPDPGPPDSGSRCGAPRESRSASSPGLRTRRPLRYGADTSPASAPTSRRLCKGRLNSSSHNTVALRAATARTCVNSLDHGRGLVPGVRSPARVPPVAASGVRPPSSFATAASPGGRGPARPAACGSPAQSRAAARRSANRPSIRSRTPCNASRL